MPLLSFQKSNASNQFTALSLNVQSLGSKYDKLKILLSDLDCTFSIIALQEVWSIGRDFSLDGYNAPIYKTRDQDLTIRNPGCGGGVLFYINKKIQYKILDFPNQFVVSSYESLWVQLDLGSESVIIGNIYRPPKY